MFFSIQWHNTNKSYGLQIGQALASVVSNPSARGFFREITANTRPTLFGIPIDLMSGTLASFKGSRIHYSPLLQPSVTHAGYKCVILDPKLKQSSPQVYQAILDFATTNQLKICKE